MSIDFSGGLLDNKTLLVGPEINGSYYNNVTTFATDNNENTSHSIVSGENTIYYEFPEPVDIKRYKVIRSYKTGQLQYILDGEELVRKLQITDYDGKDVIVDLKNVKKVGLYASAFKTIEFNVYDKLPPVNKYLFKDGEEIKYIKTGTQRGNLIPMLSISNSGNPMFVPRASENSIGAWRAFDGLLSYGWPLNNDTGWIEIKIDESKNKPIVAYSLSCNGSDSPESWRLLGSNDGATFSTIDTKDGITDWEGQTKKVFELPEPRKFNYYRLDIKKRVSSGTRVFIGEIELIVENETQSWESSQEINLSKELFDLHGMSDLSLINDEAMQQLSSDQVELLCWTDELTPSRQVGVTGLPHHSLIASSNDIPLEGAEKVTLSVNQATGAVIRIAVSSDDGVTWKGKSSLTLNDIASVKANGFTPEELNALTKEEIATLFQNGTTRFAFYLEQENLTDVVEIQSLSVGEKQYTISPTATDLSLIYEVLQEEKPTIYTSRDDGVSWKEISQDEMASLSEQPEGKNLRVKAILKNGQEIHAMSYAWA